MNYKELQTHFMEITDEEEAHCIPNGNKIIICFICNAKMSKIHELRKHMQIHEQTKCNSIETAPIYYDIFNPQKRNIETNFIHDFIQKEIREKRHSQFYCILSEAGLEMNISDSETDSEIDGNKTENDIRHYIYTCDLCHISFDRRYKALFHQKTVHFFHKLPFKCNYCDYQFIGLQLLIHHLKVACENDEYPTSCLERFREFLLKKNLEHFEYLAQARKDLKTHRLKMAARIYKCQICNKAFIRSEHLKRHKTVHFPDAEKVECPVCLKKFNRKDNLQIHMKTHFDKVEHETTNNQETNPILCQYCGYCMNTKANYLTHMRSHTGEKLFICNICGLGFSNSSEFKSHRTGHTLERTFSC